MNSTNWIEVEKYLEEQEREALAKEGIILPKDHMQGYKYQPKTKIVDKSTWDVHPVPNARPTSRAENWSHKDVNFEIGDGIAYITLNRPDANNVINDSMMTALNDACCELHANSSVRVVVLRAEGKMFCAGYDPKWFTDSAAMSDNDRRKATWSFMKFLYYFQTLPQFTIGLVQGSAMGVGLGFLAACDTVIAAKVARFTSPEVKLGFSPAAFAPVLAQKVGYNNAIHMLCTGDNFTAEKCQDMGLLNEVVEDAGYFAGRVATLCEKLTLCAPVATGRSKRLVQNIGRQPVTMSVLEYTGRELASIRTEQEAVEGMAAVQAKTKPSWAEVPIKPMPGR